MEARTIVLPNGIDLAVLESGSGGRPLLLVHGHTGAKEDFADHVPALAAEGWWVVAPDLRGHGASSKPADEAVYTLDHFAEDVHLLVEALGWDRLVLLGHSMGGMIAQIVALASPQRLAALVLMNTSHGPIDVDPELAALGAEVTRNEGLQAVRDILDAAGGPLDTGPQARLKAERPGYKEFGDRKFLACSPEMYAATLEHLLVQDDRIDALADLQVPTLVLVGAEDDKFLAPSKRLAETIPGARCAVIDDAGHSPQFEHPEQWWSALIEFLVSV